MQTLGKRRMMRAAAAALLAVMPGIAAAAPAPGSLQAAFDAADAELAAGRYALAEAGFAALEARILARPTPNAHSLAAARVGHAQAKAGLGDNAGAIALFTAALPGLGGAGDTELKRLALTDLGQAEEAQYDWLPANRHYAQALALAPGDDGKLRSTLTMFTARTQLFDDPAGTVKLLADALPRAQAAFKDEPAALGQYLALYGRALMNAHEYKAARGVLERALRASGGLRLDKVSASMVVVRSDAALAAELGGDRDKAIEYTAYTGAGRGAKAVLGQPADGQPPACGGAADIHPDDVAVVQFSVDDRGTVRSATPIYASRAGPMALAFATAVKDWSWSPEQVAKVSGFFRTAVRFELRCSTRAERQSPLRLLSQAIRAPNADSGLGADGEANDARLAQARAALARGEAEFGSGSLQLLRPLVAIGSSPLVNGVEREAMLQRAERIARGHGGSADTLAYLAISRILTASDGADTSYFARKRRLTALRALADDPAIARDPHARAVTVLMQIDYGRSGPDAIQALRDIVALPPSALPADDQVRQAAAIRLASALAGAGAQTEAETAFKASGLAPDQCALLDAEPKMKSTGASSNDFPDTALRLGFEGWAVTEFDVLASGHTRAPRTIIAYPPFLFGDASTRILNRATFQPTFRPDGVLSCGGYQTAVRYQQPGLNR